MCRGSWETTAVWWIRAILWRKGQAAVSNCTLQFDSQRAPFRGIHSVQDACPLFVLDRSRSGFHSTVQSDTLLQEEVCVRNLPPHRACFHHHVRTDRSRSVASERYQNMTVPLCDGPAWTGANPQTEHNSLFGRACPWLVWAVETKTKVSVNPHPSLLLRAVADEAVHIYRRTSQVCYGAGGPRWIACTDRRCYCESAYDPKRKQNASSPKRR